MIVDIEKILSFNGNKYEITCAMIKYARYLSQKNDDMLEIPISNDKKEKVTVLAINELLNGKVNFTYEQSENSK